MRSGLLFVSMSLLAVGCAAPGSLIDETDAPAELAVVGAAAADGDDPPTADELAAATPVAAVAVARVVVRSNELQYYALPDGAGVSVREAGPSGVFLDAGDSGLATYLAITPAGAPVPAALIDAEPSPEVRERARSRTVVESIAGAIAGSDAAGRALDDLIAAHGTATSQSLCSGTTSQAFHDDICPLTNWDVDFCHNGTWYSVTDSVGSSNKKHSSRSVTLGCGANGRVRHYYKAGAWYEPIDEQTPSGVPIQWSHYGGWKLQRAITHSRTTNSSFVRGSSHFNH